ncbi:MAG: hypothetical protein RIS64_421 [Bacteroidota bacterium]|jgi:hypothetical protein
MVGLLELLLKRFEIPLWKTPVSETIVSENGRFKVEKPPAENSEKGHPKNQFFTISDFGWRILGVPPCLYLESLRIFLVLFWV